MMVVVVLSKVATVQSRGWAGNVEAECIVVMVQGDASGRGWTLLSYVEI